EDVALDEIRPGAVALESVLLDGDDLQAGGAARLEAVLHLAEEHRPVFLADRLEHLDRGDAVVAAGLVAIILEPYLDLLRQPRARDALLREIVLLAADRQPRHPAADLAGGELG